MLALVIRQRIPKKKRQIETKNETKMTNKTVQLNINVSMKPTEKCIKSCERPTGVLS